MIQIVKVPKETLFRFGVEIFVFLCYDFRLTALVSFPTLCSHAQIDQRIREILIEQPDPSLRVSMAIQYYPMGTFLRKV